MATQQKQLELEQQIIKDTLARIASHRGVVGYLILNPRDGSVMESSGFNNDKNLAELYAEKLQAFLSVTQSVVRTLDHDDDLAFLRLRWGRREIIIAPDVHRDYVVIVVHDQHGEAEKSTVAADLEASKPPPELGATVAQAAIAPVPAAPQASAEGVAATLKQ